MYFSRFSASLFLDTIKKTNHQFFIFFQNNDAILLLHPVIFIETVCVGRFFFFVWSQITLSPLVNQSRILCTHFRRVINWFFGCFLWQDTLWNNIQDRICLVKGYIIGYIRLHFHYFFQLSNIVRNSLVSSPSQLFILSELKCKDSRNASVIWLISHEIKKCSSRADSIFPIAFIPLWIFMLLCYCSNAWPTPIDQNDTKLLLTDKCPSKKKFQVSGSLLYRSYICDK